MIKTELRGKLVAVLVIALIVMSVFSGVVASENSPSSVSASGASDYSGEILDYETSGD